MASIERVLLDTCVASYLMKGGSNGKRYAPLVANKLLAISFVTVGEMYYGAYLADWSKRKLDNLEKNLKRLVVIPYDGDITLRFARIFADTRKGGAQMSFPDAWIAACAIRHAIPLITNNARHFRAVDGLEVRTAPAPDAEQTNIFRNETSTDP